MELDTIIKTVDVLQTAQSFRSHSLCLAKSTLTDKNFGMNTPGETFLDKVLSDHSMAIAILNKSEEFVKNTTAASKYIPRRPRISIN